MIVHLPAKPCKCDIPIAREWEAQWIPSSLSEFGLAILTQQFGRENISDWQERAKLFIGKRKLSFVIST